VSPSNGKVRLPCWQFEPRIFSALRSISVCLGTSDGWQLLDFLETPHGTLSGLTPRAALEQGAALERILMVAKAEVH
jgi:hypothetical protein